MTFRSAMLGLITGLTLTTAAFAASAAEGTQPVAKPPQDFPYFVGVSGGAGYAMLSHPEISTTVGGIGGLNVGFATAALNLHGGYTINDHINVGLEFSALETGISRNNGGESFKIGFSPQAGCNNCHAPLAGADVVATTLVFSTLGARVEYTPFGRDGFFLGATAGVAMLVGFDDKQGFGATGRLGYRVRPTNIMTISFEAGVQGQLYGDAQLYMPYGAAVLRPYF